MTILRGVFGFLFCLTLCAQHDLSFWNRNGYGENVQFPWYTYFGKKFTADARYNYDQKKTASLYFGKQIGSERFSIVPEAGILLGSYNGISPQLYILVNRGKLNLFTQHQYVRGIGKSFNFQYHWIDASWSVWRRIAPGIDYQVYHEPRSGFVEHDLGPTVKFFLPVVRQKGKKLIAPYIKAWCARSLGPQRFGENQIHLSIGGSF